MQGGCEWVAVAEALPLSELQAEGSSRPRGWKSWQALVTRVASRQGKSVSNWDLAVLCPAAHAPRALYLRQLLLQACDLVSRRWTP
jgi:hypothetical protein